MYRHQSMCVCCWCFCSDIVHIISPFLYASFWFVCYATNSICLAFAEFLCSNKPYAQIHKYQNLRQHIWQNLSIFMSIIVFVSCHLLCHSHSQHVKSEHFHLLYTCAGLQCYIPNSNAVSLEMVQCTSNGNQKIFSSCCFDQPSKLSLQCILLGIYYCKLQPILDFSIDLSFLQ